jgi:hypothetical protein
MTSTTTTAMEGLMEKVRALVDVAVDNVHGCDREAGSDAYASAYVDLERALAGRLAATASIPDGYVLAPADPAQRATDLHENLGMPWPQADELVLSEVGIIDMDIDEMIGESHVTTLLDFVPRDSLREFVRGLLVHNAHRATRGVLGTVEAPDGGPHG